MHLLFFSFSFSRSLSGSFSSTVMLAVSALRNSDPCEKAVDAGAASLPAADDFSAEFDFDFSELFAGFEDGEVLPGLEVDPSETMLSFSSPETVSVEVETKGSTGDSGGSDQQEGTHVVAEREEMVYIGNKEALSGEMVEEASPETETRRKPSARHAKNSNGKKKMKVDWTPELHRQFVQAVEQLGVEKAVPSRILELMGIDCLTRHNVASHLQKYRSHRKHMLVREAEATGWSHRRQVFPMTETAAKSSSIMGPAREINTWLGPTMGFPPGGAPPHHLHPHHTHMHAFRPLHVWGHPSTDQSLVHPWLPKFLFPIRPAPSPPWMAARSPFQPPSSPYASPWNSHFSSDALSQGTPYFSQQVPTLRFPPPVTGIPPQTMSQPVDAVQVAAPPAPATANQIGWQLPQDVHPSMENIDAAIGEVLAQPWLPVPLGLKPPSLESVMLELQKQGVSVVPPCN